MKTMNIENDDLIVRDKSMPFGRFVIAFFSLPFVSAAIAGMLDGKNGMVMLGIDETETLATDQQLHMLTARWEKIFIAIQDPALVV